MKKIIPILILATIVFSSCKSTNKASKITIDKTYAWCIVPYDSQKRSPKERVDMLKELGITKYAYDWRDEHLYQLAEELQIAKQNDITVISVWLWIDNNSNSIEKLSDVNEKLFHILKQANYKGQIWLSFNSNFFEGLTDSGAVEKGAKMISKISKMASSVNCKVALYNHGDWFGEPENQIKIINTLPNEDLGLIYNFHHAHHQIDTFPDLVETILPYLWSVNLNGIKKGGPKILTIGEGDYEIKMIDQLLNAGYKGDFGILGHIETSDVKDVLQANLDGLKKY